MTQEIIEWGVTENAINELNQTYMLLKIDGVKDKQGYEVVSTARKHVKSLRIQVDKRRKELTEDALRHQQKINSEAKRITGLLDPIETHLHSQEKAIDAEIERIKQEKIAELKLKTQLRIDKLIALEFIFDGKQWQANYDHGNCTLLVTHDNLQKMSEDDFENNILEFTQLYAKHLEAKAIAEFDAKMKREEEQRQREAEQEIIKQKRREQELENERLADIARKQQEEKNRLEAEAKALADLELELKMKKEFQEKAERDRERVNFLKLLEIEKQRAEEDKNFAMRSVESIEQKNSIQGSDGKKYFFVEISGIFSASGSYLASSEEEAEDMALGELHNLEPNALSFDFEQRDVEVSEEEKGE